MADVSEESYVNVENVTAIRMAIQMLSECLFLEDQADNKKALREILAKLHDLQRSVSNEIHVTT